jgi:prepilin-type N-terminal cleavage/methylation domain-containing protein
MTTSATGDRTRTGFTLLEILLALGLIAMLSAAVIGISSNLLSERTATPEEVFWKAAEAARRAALKSGKEADLSFDDKGKAFQLSDGAGVKTFGVPGADPSLSVDFLAPAGGPSSAVLVGGMLLETGALPRVAFYSDGTCLQFRVQFSAKGSSHIVSIDPWTCAPMLAPQEGSP